MSEYLNSLLGAVLVQDGFIFHDVVWWGRFKKISDGVNNADIGHVSIMEVTGTSNQVSPYHRALIGHFIIVVDVGMIP